MKTIVSIAYLAVSVAFISTCSEPKTEIKRTDTGVESTQTVEKKDKEGVEQDGK